MAVTPVVTTFSVWDYVVFGIILLISIGIGIYHAFSGGRQRSTSEFLLANRSMSALPVALSVLASFFSASTLLGTPAEIYLRGTMYWISVFGALLAPLAGAFIFGPLFYRLKVVSIFEYLEHRFQSKAVRLLGAILFMIKATLGMGIVLFGPSTALSAVTGFPVWAAIVTTTAVCAIYTSLGGIKAVIWTDVFQTCIMLAGMLAVLIQGSIETKGISNAWKVCEEGGRIQFFDFNPDPTVRHTFWTLVVGNVFVWLPPYTVDQQMMQRFGSTKSLRDAKLSLIYNVPGMFIIITLCCLAGIFMYAYYAGCDPLTTGVVNDPNQLMPRFVMDILGFAPGIPGLFMSCLFSGALSSISSMLNSLAAVTWEDLIKLSACARSIDDQRATVITKLLSIGFALVGIGMGFLFSIVGGTVLQMSIAFNGAAGAPSVGLFVLGVFFPWANWIGAFVGGVSGFVFSMWISIGAYVTKPDVMKNLPNSINNCTAIVSNLTSTIGTWISTEGYGTTSMPESVSGLIKLYSLSYMYYTVVGILVTVVVGIVVSLLTGGRKTAKDVDPQYLLAYVDIFWPCFPKSCRRKCYCGIDFDAGKEEAKQESDVDYVSQSGTWKHPAELATMESSGSFNYSSTDDTGQIASLTDNPKSLNSSAGRPTGSNMI